jgi:CheY-like chemotaxis protein
MPRVLLVGARPDRAAALAAALAGWGYAVRFARDRASAVEVAALFLPQAALVGGLPDGETRDGVARGLRALPALAGLALVAVAGPGEPAPSGGFDFLLREPVDLADLRRLLGCLKPAPPAGPASSGREDG